MVCAVSAPDSSPLLSAFLGLLPTASPERQEQILRRGLLQILGDREEPPPRPLAPRSPSITTVDRADWAILKAQVRAALDLAGGWSLGDLAAASGVPRSTLEKTLSPAGPPAGKLIANQLQSWLDARTEPAAVPLSTETTGTAGNGHARVSDRGAHAHAGRLSTEQREKLAAFAQLLDARQFRDTFNMTVEMAGKAVAGAVMPIETVEQIVAALDGTACP